MNDQDIIRKAVELADGWGMTSDCTGAEPSWMESPNGWKIHIYTKDAELIDALAAQLVRQVDALEESHIVITPVQTTVMWYGGGVHSEGLGRTMNTLKAIVESGVLE